MTILTESVDTMTHLTISIVAAEPGKLFVFLLEIADPMVCRE
jgi:hypothetical protein